MILFLNDQETPREVRDTFNYEEHVDFDNDVIRYHKTLFHLYIS